ncbi:MAG: TonB-dependent siderophore receptor [Burkholderiaceae bacterium]|nr:TonB-dependent siderophore receptor [Burkholderiaceae bacterium]
MTVAGRADPREEATAFPEFGGLPVGELPLSVGVLRARDLRTQGVDSLSEAIRREPAASDAYNTVGYVESIQLRGFLLEGLLNYRRNGLPVSPYTPFTLVTKQQIEVMKGLNGAVTGIGNPAGTVNFVPKRATLDVSEASVDVSERGTWLAAADLGRRVGEDFGWRLNVGHGQRRPAARDADGESSVVAAAVDWRGPRGITAEAEFEVQNSRQVSVPGFGLLDVDGDGVAESLPSPSQLGPRSNLNNQPWSQPFDSRSRVGTARVSMPLGSQWRLTAAGLLQRTTTHDRLAFPDGCSTGPTYVYPGLCGNFDVDIYDYRSDNERRNTTVFDLALDGRVTLAGITHRLRLAPRSTRYAERLDPFQAYNFVGTINAIAPTPLAGDASLTSRNSHSDRAIDDLQVSDVIDLSARWRLFTGARIGRAESASWRSDGSRALRFSDDFVTPWLALSYAMAPQSLLFASVNRSVEPEAVPNRPALFVNAGDVLPVARSTQAEFGWRGDLGAAVSGSVTLFEVRRPRPDDIAVAANALGASTERVADGREQRHRGVETAWRWQASRAWALAAQGALLDATIERSADPALSGKRATNVPKLTASLQADWRGSRGLAVGQRLFYSGERAITADNRTTLPAWWQWDLWLSMPARIGGVNTVWRAAVENLTDRRFWREAPTQYWGGTYLFPAQPRTFSVGVSLLL